MNKSALLFFLLFATAFLGGWTDPVDNFYGKLLDTTTFKNPPDTAVPVFNLSTKKWEAISGGGGGGSDASTTTKGISKLSFPPASASNPIALGVNDPTVNPTPSAANAGNIPVVATGGGSYGHIDPPATTTHFLASLGDAVPAAFRAIATGDITELLALANLSDVTGTTGTGTVVALQASPTLTTPILDNPTLNNTGTSTQVLHGSAAGAASFSPVVSADITDGTVAYADIQNLAGLTLMGRAGTGPGVGADITGTANQIPIVNSGGTALAFTTVSGDLTNATGAFTIADNAVSNAKLRDSGALTVIGRSANSSGDPADIAGTANQILVVSSGSVLGFSTVSGDLTNVTGAFTIANNAVTTAKILDANVTLAKVANASANSRILGSDENGSGAAYTESALQSSLSFVSGVLGLSDSITNPTAATDFTVTATGDEVVFGDAIRLVSTSTDPANVGGLTYDTDHKAPYLKTDLGIVRLVGCVFASTSASTAIADTTTPTNFSTTFDIPANSLSAGKVIRVTYHLLYSITGSPTMQMRQLLDSTSIADSGGGVALGTGLTNFPIRVVSEIVCRTTGASGTVFTSTHVNWRNTNGVAGMGSTGSVTVDTTQALTMNLEWTWSAASASNTVTVQAMIVEGL